MKTIVVTAALVAALTSPVMAQQQPQAQDTRRPVLQSWEDPAAAFAQAHPRLLRPRSPNPQWDVYMSNGEYVGSDPDPFIRGELARDRDDD
jgi:hypothetical protein